jgi:hypothetical protein
VSVIGLLAVDAALKNKELIDYFNSCKLETVCERFNSLMQCTTL